MIYLYKRNKTGICIDRVYGYDTIVELPDMLEGFPVTELGAYIFSDHEIIDKKSAGYHLKVIFSGFLFLKIICLHRYSCTACTWKCQNN